MDGNDGNPARIPRFFPVNLVDFTDSQPSRASGFQSREQNAAVWASVHAVFTYFQSNSQPLLDLVQLRP
ncbi:hypothetical protein MGWOODY_Hyp2088 [hydrothermal vent metagenome]|uniref:Uncharacterized protein n=1 Tax=hydrothermal vent metagenome TaxID=652676 RepID=A0A160TXL0_9ZZZZ